jgi:cytochrome c
MIRRFTMATCSLVMLQLLAQQQGYGQTGKKPVATHPKPVPQQTAAQKISQKTVPKAPFATAQEIEEGKLLITKSDCFACHKVSEKLVGPAYVDVAKKYPKTDSTVGSLVNKILKGGSGVWGPVPMAPHTNLSAEDTKKIVKYILSLNAEKQAL